MAVLQVRALYNFEGQAGSGELTINSNEILTVTRQDVGEGWWEGINSRGETGLFPAAYVEVISHPPPSVPPPPLPAGYESYDGTNNMYNQATHPSAPQTYEGSDDWDEDWDDDDSTSTEQNMPTQPSVTGLSVPSQAHRSNSTGDISSFGRGSEPGSKSTVKKNFNRFSSFVKSGGEAYILGQTKLLVSESEKIVILETSDGISWPPVTKPYFCKIASPKKQNKLKGLKTFIAYQMTPTFTNIQVSRRYKHFDWLHQRLEEKFTLIPIPPLPDKQISGRYEDSFIEHRMAQLQNWVNRICRHPVLSQSEVWQHFLTCTDDKQWKIGKRKAEKDELVGASFFLAIAPPPTPLDVQTVDVHMDTFSRFVKNMDDSVRQMQITMNDQIKKHTGPYRREYQKIGAAFKSLAGSFEIHSKTSSQELTRAIRHTGETYDDIGKLFEEQPRYDLEPLCDVLYEYKGILGAFPDIIQVHKGAVQKKREYERLGQEGRADVAQVQNINQRTDTVSYTCLAEINNFHQERVEDFKAAMESYLTDQVKFYEKIVQKLQMSLEKYQQM